MAAIHQQYETVLRTLAENRCNMANAMAVLASNGKHEKRRKVAAPQVQRPILQVELLKKGGAPLEATKFEKVNDQQ